MDSRLQERLTKLHEQIELLEKVEHEYLHLEAHQKVLFAQLYAKAEGSNISEKENWVRRNEDYIAFINGLTLAKTEFNKQYRVYELKRKAYDAEHLTYKIENSGAQRG